MNGLVSSPRLRSKKTIKKDDLSSRIYQVEAAIDLHRDRGLSDDRLADILGGFLDDEQDVRDSKE